MNIATPTPRWLAALVMALVSAAAWWAWMGWDTTYQVDPATGARTGPYEAWQVVGCGLTLLVAGVLAARVLPIWVLVPVVVVPFAVSWTVTALLTTDSPLWMVGLVLLVVGVTAVTVVVGLLARLFWRFRAKVSPSG